MKEEALNLADDLKDVADVLGSNNIEATVIGKGADMIRKLVAELDKQGEPVAWMSKHGSFIGKIKDEICHIPLYTALQTKPLSTDDLLEPAYKHLFRAEHSNDEIDISYWFTPEELVEYARAIEERILGK